MPPAEVGPWPNQPSRHHLLNHANFQVPGSHLRESHLHLANEPILINRSPLLAITLPRRLRPHLLHVLQNHIAMPIKRLHPRQQLLVIATRDQDLGM